MMLPTSPSPRQKPAEIRAVATRGFAWVASRCTNGAGAAHPTPLAGSLTNYSTFSNFRWLLRPKAQPPVFGAPAMGWSWCGRSCSGVIRRGTCTMVAVPARSSSDTALLSTSRPSRPSLPLACLPHAMKATTGRAPGLAQHPARSLALRPVRYPTMQGGPSADDPTFRANKPASVSFKSIGAIGSGGLSCDFFVRWAGLEHHGLQGRDRQCSRNS